MSNKIFPILLVATSICLGVLFRLYPAYLPALDLEAKAALMAERAETVDEIIKKQYPGLSDTFKEQVKEDFLSTDKTFSEKDLELLTIGRAAQLKSRYLDENGETYINGIDSYYWLRLLTNLVDKGHVGDRIVDGVEFDDLIGAPVDNESKRNIHLWFGFAFYKVFSFFKSDVPLKTVLFYVPIIFSCFIAIFSFQTAKRLGASDLGAFFACVAINLSPFFLVRSIGEWFDTDIYNVLFPLLAFWAYVGVFAREKMSQRIFSSLLSGLFLACYASSWKGWWTIFDVMLISGLLYILNRKMSFSESSGDQESVRLDLIALGCFVASTAVAVIYLNGFSVWQNFIAEPIKMMGILKVTPQGAWPNVFLTVAELEHISPQKVIAFLGGYFMFFVALLGIVYSILFQKGLRNKQSGFGLMCLVLWLVTAFYTSTQAMRFILLLVVPVGLAFGLSISHIYALIGKVTNRFKNIYLDLGLRYLFILIFSLFLIFNTSTIHSGALTAIPLMDDHWYGVLTNIEKETAADAHINSWWDYGHWFKALAGRRVLFDGMTQNTPYAYWMASMLLSSSQREAIGILRMINTSGNEAYESLKRVGFNEPDAVAFIKELVSLDKMGAEKKLQKILPPENAKVFLEYLFPDQLPDVYFIISYDMINKIGAISYVGNWDFTKMDMWLKSKTYTSDAFIKYVAKRYNYSDEEARTKLLETVLLDEKRARQWSTEVWRFGSREASLKSEDGALRFFEDGCVVNVDNDHVYLQSEVPSRAGVPENLFRMEKEKLLKIPQQDSTLPYSVLLIEWGKEQKLCSRLMDTKLASSMLVRLYYLRGVGLNAFELFDKQENEDGGIIYVYKILWDKV